MTLSFIISAGLFLVIMTAVWMFMRWQMRKFSDEVTTINTILVNQAVTVQQQHRRRFGRPSTAVEDVIQTPVLSPKAAFNGGARTSKGAH